MVSWLLFLFCNSYITGWKLYPSYWQVSWSGSSSDLCLRDICMFQYSYNYCEWSMPLFSALFLDKCGVSKPYSKLWPGLHRLPKNLGARKLTWSKFGTEYWQFWIDLWTSLLSGPFCLVCVCVNWYTFLHVRKETAVTMLTILGTMVQNSVTPATGVPGFVHPWPWPLCPQSSGVQWTSFISRH